MYWTWPRPTCPALTGQSRPATARIHRLKVNVKYVSESFYITSPEDQIFDDGLPK